MADPSPLSILLEGNPRQKADKARQYFAALKSAGMAPDHTDAPPDQPARPDRPILVEPKDLARRRLGSDEGRAALLHAIAHIELNAIDLAADMIARFSGAPELSDQRNDFVADWASVCDDEARHFVMIDDRLNALGFTYGDFPAHGGLWDAAMKTRDDIAARLAVAPLVLEARGLDVTPGMIAKLDQVGDRESADLLRVIYDDEVGHVAIGMKWFRHVAENRRKEPRDYFQTLVRNHYGASLKPPFNSEARQNAGFPPDFYANFTVNPES